MTDTHTATRPTIEQAAAARDAEFVGYSTIPLEWENVSDEDMEKEWSGISETCRTFKLVNREQVAAACGKDKSWEISWVSYGFSNGKVVCFAS
jgi:hypothetical protein